MLLVSFIGAPCSGKTTTMLKLCAKLKDAGIPLEFSGEFAREFIHWKKAAAKREGRLFSPEFTNEDQWEIMQTQAMREENALESFQDIPIGVVISDGSPLNSTLYMTPEFRASPQVKNLCRQIVQKRGGLMFYNEPFDHPTYLNTADPNRIHGVEQQKAINDLIPEMLKEWGASSVIHLVGSQETRLSRAYSAVYARIEHVLKQRQQEQR